MSRAPAFLSAVYHEKGRLLYQLSRNHTAGKRKYTFRRPRLLKCRALAGGTFTPHRKTGPGGLSAGTGFLLKFEVQKKLGEFPQAMPKGCLTAFPLPSRPARPQCADCPPCRRRRSHGHGGSWQRPGWGCTPQPGSHHRPGAEGCCPLCPGW